MRPFGSGKLSVKQIEGDTFSVNVEASIPSDILTLNLKCLLSWRATQALVCTWLQWHQFMKVTDEQLDEASVRCAVCRSSSLLARYSAAHPLFRCSSSFADSAGKRIALTPHPDY
ncbi:uncharacterized [Tachysurus ichikawai]